MVKPFFAWQDKMFVKINPQEVICLSTEGNYTRIFLVNRTFYMVRTSLSKALKKLPRDLFIKTHRSYAVSVYQVDCIYTDHLIVAGEPLPIGKQYYQSLIDKLNIIE